MSRRAGLLQAAVLGAGVLAGHALASGPPSAAGGLLAFQRVPVPEGVPAHLVSALAQDGPGFLWIGTQDGLVRFDGLELRTYRSDPRDPATLGGAYVRSLLPGRDGRIWVGSFSGGLSCLDPATERFERFRNDPSDPASLGNDRVEGLAEDREGRLWVATSGGLDRLDPATGRFTHFRPSAGDPRSLADPLVRAVLVDRDGTLWVGGGSGLQRFRGEASGFEPVRLGGPGREPPARLFVSRLRQDAKGRIWVGTTERGAAVLDPSTGAVTWLRPRPDDPDGLSHFWVYGFAEAAGGAEVWVATFGGGVDVVDSGSLRVVARLRHDPTLEETIGGDRVGALLEDRSGVVWVGTWGQGLARHDPSTRAFRALRYSPGRPDGLTHPSVVRALARRSGTTWAGTDGNGIDVLDAGLRRVGGLRRGPASDGALADGSISCLAEAADGTAWVASLDGTLHRLRPGSRRFERLTAADGLPGGPIRAITFGRDGGTWVGAAQGMARVDPITLAVRSYRSWPGAAGATLAVEAIAGAADGTLWVGTGDGLYSFDPGTGASVRVAREPGRDDSLPDNWVPDLLVARDGRLWVATAGGAAVLDSWDGKKARFTSVAASLGRAPGRVDTLVEDADGNVWLGPSLRVDARLSSATEFGRAEGCAFRSFFIASRSRASDGTLLFGSPEGLLAVDPRAVRPWTFDPRVVATALQVDGKPLPGASVTRAVTLPAGASGFRLDVAALDLTAPERNRYRYRLEGLEASWNVAGGAQRSLAYGHLPPGRYTLRVEGSNRDGRFGRHPLALAVVVLPRLDQTVWFRALLVAAAGAAAWGGFRLRVRQLRERSLRLERLVERRTAELAERNRELAAAYARIEEASLTDPLTGLRNRRFLEQTVASDLEVAARGEADLVFLLLDLDRFKAVNDTFGHAAGDAVLVQLAAVLRSTLRSADHVVRWGGEEFLVVLRFVDRATAPDVAEKLREGIAAHRFALLDGTLLSKTASIGFASYPFSRRDPHAAPWGRVVEAADGCLYAAKRSGRDAWVGVEEGPGAPGEALARFRDDPAGAASEGAVRVVASTRIASALTWA